MQIVYRLLFSVSQRSSTSAGANSDWSDAVAEADVVLPKKGMVLLFQPLSIAFNHINYFIDMPPTVELEVLLKPITSAKEIPDK
jgi:hypothetical protein